MYKTHKVSKTLWVLSLSYKRAGIKIQKVAKDKIIINTFVPKSLSGIEQRKMNISKQVIAFASFTAVSRNGVSVHEILPKQKPFCRVRRPILPRA